MMLSLWLHRTAVMNHVKKKTDPGIGCSGCSHPRLVMKAQVTCFGHNVWAGKGKNKTANTRRRSQAFFFSIRLLDSLINVWEARWPTRTCESNCCLSACSEDSPEGWLGGNPRGRLGTEPLTAGLEIQQGAGKMTVCMPGFPLFHTVISSKQIDGLMEDWNKDHIPTH